DFHVTGVQTCALPICRVFPDAAAIAALATFDQPLPEHGRAAEQVLRELDEIGSPATVTSNGPRYFGFVIGATLPAAAAAERLVRSEARRVGAERYWRP